MSQINLDEVVGAVVSDDGVTNITQGTVACDHVRTLLSSILRAADPVGYTEYRKIKRPAGAGSSTLETRREATRFLFDRVRDLLVPYYLPTKGR